MTSDLTPSIRPPHSVFIFTLEDIKAITLHFLNTFFRYYNAYFFAFTPLVYLEVRTSEVKVQRDQRDENIEALRQEAE
jgi:exonuclease V gamma subunit